MGASGILIQRRVGPVTGSIRKIDSSLSSHTLKSELRLQESKELV